MQNEHRVKTRVQNVHSAISARNEQTVRISAQNVQSVNQKLMIRM